MTTPNLKPFRELKARKAKYGFEARVDIPTIPAVAEAMKQTKWVDPSCRFEFKTDMGSNEFKIYSDNDNLADLMRATFVK